MLCCACVDLVWIFFCISMFPSLVPVLITSTSALASSNFSCSDHLAGPFFTSISLWYSSWWIDARCTCKPMRELNRLVHSLHRNSPRSSSGGPEHWRWWIFGTCCIVWWCYLMLVCASTSSGEGTSLDWDLRRGRKGISIRKAPRFLDGRSSSLMLLRGRPYALQDSWMCGLEVETSWTSLIVVFLQRTVFGTLSRPAKPR